MRSDACPKAGRRYINAGWLSSGTKRKYTPFSTGWRKLDRRGLSDIHIIRFSIAGAVAAGLCRRAIGNSNLKDKHKAFKACATCQTLLDGFLRDTARGQAAARARLKTDPSDEAAQFLLGKLDLNYTR